MPFKIRPNGRHRLNSLLQGEEKISRAGRFVPARLSTLLVAVCPGNVSDRVVGNRDQDSLLRPPHASASVAPSLRGLPRYRNVRRVRVRTPSTRHAPRKPDTPSWPHESSRPSPGRTPPDQSERRVHAPASPTLRP